MFTHLERELVDGVDLIEVIQDEIHQGGTGGRGPVQLPGLVDLDLRDLCLFHLHRDVGSGALGGLQVLHKGCVPEEVALGGGEAGQEVVF